jgi:hypothetical protein
MHNFFFDGSVPSSLRLGTGLVFGGILMLAALWSLAWKGLALWKAARSGSKWWFVILLIVNTFGILDILYIYVFSRKGGIGKMMSPVKPVASAIDDEKDATVV